MIRFNENIRKDYIRSIDLALNFIDNNLDSKTLTLENISKKALYSPFHFHRIFKAITGEPLNAYIIRRRVEKSASALIHKNHISITEISLAFGFSSNSSFTRAFKNFYGMSPSQFRKKNSNTFSKIRKIDSKKGQETLITEKYICNINNYLNWIKMNATIEIKEVPDLQFASITHIGVNGIEDVFHRLIKWATPKGLMKSPEAKMARIFHDSFKITSPDKVRMSVSLLTKEPFKPEDEVSATTIKPRKCIVGRFEILPKDFEQAWTGLFIWMSDNGYKKADINPFEIYQNDSREHPEKKFIVDLYIPIL